MEEVEELSILVTDIQSRSQEPDELEILKCRLEYGITFLIDCLQDSFTQPVNELIIHLSVFHRILCREIQQAFSSRLAIFQFDQQHQPILGPGRPKYEISEETLVNLREIGFKWCEIAELLLVSRWTIQRRVKEFGIADITGYSNISDSDLDEYVREAKNKYGSSAGRSLITGFLRASGLRIQRKRVIKSLIRIDPLNSRLRWASLVKRRRYSVPGPNSLWHADGHHSLINWGFVIHGAIDGYSRLIVYLKCCTNNKAETVLANFLTACAQFGYPSRLRTDKGGENILLWNEMEQKRGSNRGSFIAGSSVHNQRIERLWRDVWNYVACQYYYTFQSLEAEGVLDTTNVKHVYILHYIFLPRINYTIRHFVSGWNKHPLRTEGNWSPEKIWSNGMLDLRNKNLIQMNELRDNVEEANYDLTWFGYDPNAPAPSDIEISEVDLFDCDSPFTCEEEIVLRSIDLLQHSAEFGIDIYLNVCELLFC